MEGKLYIALMEKDSWNRYDMQKNGDGRSGGLDSCFYDLPTKVLDSGYLWESYYSGAKIEYPLFFSEFDNFKEYIYYEHAMDSDDKEETLTGEWEAKALRNYMIMLGKYSADNNIDRHLFNPKRLVAAAAEYYGIGVTAIQSHKQDKKMDEMRQLIWALCRLADANWDDMDNAIKHGGLGEEAFDFHKKYAFTKQDAFTDAKTIIEICSRR